MGPSLARSGEESGRERADRGVVAPSERILGDELAADTNGGSTGVEHLANVVECDAASGHQRNVWKRPAQRPQVRRTADALHGKDLHHVSAKAKCLEYFGGRERTRENGDFSATRGVDYFRHKARRDDEFRTSIYRSPCRLSVSNRPRPEEYLAAEPFRHGADRVDRVRYRHRDFGYCESGLQQRFDDRHRGVRARGTNDRDDSNLTNRR